MKLKTTNDLISKLFNPPSTSSVKALEAYFVQALDIYTSLVNSPQGLGTVFPILSICMKYMDQFVNHNVNLYFIGLHSH